MPRLQASGNAQLANRAVCCMVLVNICALAVVLVLGGAEHDNYLSDESIREQAKPEDLVGHILDGLTGGNKALQSTGDEVEATPRLDSTVHGLTARFGKKAKPVAKKAKKAEKVSKGDPLLDAGSDWYDHDEASDKLLKYAAGDMDDEDPKPIKKKTGWSKYAKHISLVPNMYKEKVESWLKHPTRHTPSWMLRKGSKKTHATKKTAKAVAKRVQRTAVEAHVEALEQPTAPVPAVLQIHASLPMVLPHSGPEKQTAVKRTVKPAQSAPAKASKSPVATTPTVKKTAVKKAVKAAAGADAVVPEKVEGPLQQLRSAHRAIQLATRSHLTVHAAPLIQAKIPAKLAPTAQAKAKKAKETKKEAEIHPKAGDFQRIEKLGDFTHADKREDRKDDEDSSAAKESSWFHKLLKHPGSAVEDAEDGQSIQGFLHAEAKALKNAGKAPASTKSVLNQQMAEQQDTTGVEHITPLSDAPRPRKFSPAAEVASTHPRKFSPEALAPKKAPQVGDVLHDPLQPTNAKATDPEATQGKSMVDSIIKSLGGGREYAE